jgi:hypothetical protein
MFTGSFRKFADTKFRNDVAPNARIKLSCNIDNKDREYDRSGRDPGDRNLCKRNHL